MNPAINPITPVGLAALRARYDHLLGTERPQIVEVVSWAAGNGDRSENLTTSMAASDCARSTASFPTCRAG